MPMEVSGFMVLGTFSIVMQKDGNHGIMFTSSHEAHELDEQSRAHIFTGVAALANQMADAAKLDYEDTVKAAN